MAARPATAARWSTRLRSCRSRRPDWRRVQRRRPASGTGCPRRTAAPAVRRTSSRPSPDWAGTGWPPAAAAPCSPACRRPRAAGSRGRRRTPG
ncbi:MAG: hypothetical protein FJ265_15085 [Planctomycetes bacterium]|nr:hypothetical protein [Planctomycetota bacterium]